MSSSHNSPSVNGQNQTPSTSDSATNSTQHKHESLKERFRSIFLSSDDGKKARTTQKNLENQTPKEENAVATSLLGDDSNEKKVTVNHPVKTGFLFATGVAFVVLLILIGQNISQLLLWIVTAMFICLGLDPIVSFFERKGLKRGWGVAITFGILVAIVALFFINAIPILTDQITSLIHNMPQWIQSVVDSDQFKHLDQQYHIQQNVSKWFEGLQKNAPDLVGNSASTAIQVGTNIGNGVFGTFMVLIMTLYFLVSLPSIKRWLNKLAPASKRPAVVVLSDQITNNVGNYVMGQTTVALLQGIMAFILMSLAGTQYATLVAFGCALLAFIPMVGGMLAAILASGVTLLTTFGQEGWVPTIIVIIVYIVYLQIEANFISPKIMSHAVSVPPIVSIIAVIAGGSLLGVLGALIAIPTAASIILLIKELWIPRQNQR